MTTIDLLDFCTRAAASVIYIAIGCSQAHHITPTELQDGQMIGQEIQQEYPNFMADIPGRQICILIDPLLESPPIAFRRVAEDPSGLTEIGRVSFITQRRYFEWTEGGNDRLLLEHLSILSMHTPTRLIVQDYTGEYIHKYYPIDRLGPILAKKVLYDFTYHDGGCFVDFTKVKLLMRPDGTFVQPRYESLTSCVPYLSNDQLQLQVKERHNVITNYVRRLYRIQRDEEEYRDWCTTDVILWRMEPLCRIYECPLQTDNPTLEKFMVNYLWDLCGLVRDYISEGDAYAAVRASTNAYIEMIDLLKSVVV